jgi:hypothetical protein
VTKRVTTLKWQLKIADRFVKAGSLLDIIERWQTGGSVLLKLREVESGCSVEIWVRDNVNIGGKNYLLFKEVDHAGDEFVVARLIDKHRLCAMDPDRFSSLSNALTSFLESQPATTLAEFENVFGALPLVPPK